MVLRAKLYDIAIAVPLIVFAVAALWSQLSEFARLADLVRSGDMTALTGAANVMFGIMVNVLLVWLVVVRDVPKAKTAGFAPRLIALAGTVGALAISTPPSVRLSLPVAIATMVPVLIGGAGVVVSLGWLGKRFSIMPEARGLVTTGPYAIIRHPLYFFEELAFFGLALQHAQPWAMIAFAAQFTLQVVRIQYEERILTETFPEYADYSRRTSRLIPGLY